MTTVVDSKTADMDILLAGRIGQGDKEAFQILFDRHEASIYRFCLLILGNEDVAQDIYQETFFSFYQFCREKKAIRNVRGWLFSKSRSLCLNHLRDSKRRMELLQSRDAVNAISMDIASIGIEEHLRKALLEIPHHYREALLLFEVEGYSYKEIEEYLGVDFHTVKNRIYQAKQGLQKILGPILKGIDPDEAA